MKRPILWIMNPGSKETALDESRKILFNAREKRIRPITDDKILTSWNALAITALLMLTGFLVKNIF